MDDAVDYAEKWLRRLDAMVAVVDERILSGMVGDWVGFQAARAERRTLLTVRAEVRKSIGL